MKYPDTLPLINESLLEATGDEWINAIEGNEAEIIKRCKLFPELVEALEMALGAFEKNNAIDWSILEELLAKVKA